MSATETKIVVTDRPKAPRHKSIVETPAGKKDLQVILMGWARQALIRAARTFVQTFLSALGVAGAGEAAGPGQISVGDFMTHAGTAAMVALIAALIAFLWNAGELLSRLDEKGPEWRA